MTMRVHTADIENVVLTLMAPGELEAAFGDEFEGYGDALVIVDPGNLEAFTILGDHDAIAAFARRILDALPVVLTEEEQDNLTHFCEMNDYDAAEGSIGRSYGGAAWFLSAEDATSYDLTNGLPREHLT